MTYYELIQLYKQGKLDDTQMKQVEDDIQKQDAISEYLFDQESETDLKLFLEDENNATENIDEKLSEGENFTKMIQASIRKTFVKIGMIVGTVTVAVVLFIIFVLPGIVDSFYYDPSTIVGENEYGVENNRMSMDLAVYSELYMPACYRDEVVVKDNGYGKYDITILQTTGPTGTKFTDVAGNIDKGKLVLYNPSILKNPVSNVFMPAEDVVRDNFLYEENMENDIKRDAFNAIGDLMDNQLYTGYITLNKVMSYDDFVSWVQKNGVSPDWCAICLKDSSGYYKDVANIGFCYSYGASPTGYNKEKYPLLSKWDIMSTLDEENEEVISEENMRQHVISLLCFMQDENEFCQMWEKNENDGSNYTEWIDNIKENGLNIYGFAVSATKDELLEVSKLEEVDYIYTEQVQ